MLEKTVSVEIIGDAKVAYLLIEDKVMEDLAKGTANSFCQTLLKSIRDKISVLKLQPDYGIHIPRRNVAQKYIALYGVTNLWKINLSGAWRMIYTIRQEQSGVSKVTIFVDILDIIDHNEYDKIFGYRKR